MSMSEERFPGELQGASSSSLKMGLTVAGCAIGLVLLLCGGVVGYVAWKGAEQPQQQPTASADDSAPMKPGMGPAAAEALVRTIIQIDMPVQFEPIDADENPAGCRVTFGRKDAVGTLLKLVRYDLSKAPPEFELRSTAPMLMRMAEMGDGRTSTSFIEETESSESARNLTVLGETVTFRFVKGKSRAGGQTLRKVTGTFIAGNGFVALVYTIPDENYDEEAVVRMLESIKAPEDESADKPARPPNAPNEDAPGTETEQNGTNRPKDDAPPRDAKTPEPDEEQVDSKE